jgi:hypothetical protein
MIETIVGSLMLFVLVCLLTLMIGEWNTPSRYNGYSGLRCGATHPKYGRCDRPFDHAPGRHGSHDVCGMDHRWDVTPANTDTDTDTDTNTSVSDGEAFRDALLRSKAAKEK